MRTNRRVTGAEQSPWSKQGNHNRQSKQGSPRCSYKLLKQRHNAAPGTGGTEPFVAKVTDGAQPDP